MLHVFALVTTVYERFNFLLIAQYNYNTFNCKYVAKKTLRNWIASPLEPEHGVLDAAAMALKEERKHEHAAPQNAHLWPDGRAINNRTESEPMRFNPALPP